MAENFKRAALFVKKHWRIFTERSFGQRRISTKLIWLVLAVALVPLIFTSYSIFYYAKIDLENRAVDSAVLTAEAQEGQVLFFLKALRDSTSFLASSITVTNSLKSLTEGGYHAQQTTKILNDYLARRQILLDGRMYGINITDRKGIIIASTDAQEIGRDESEEDYFYNAVKLEYGRTFLSDIGFGHHFTFIHQPFLTVSAPIREKAGGEILGVAIGYFKTAVLDDILIGRYQESLGAISGTRGRNATLDAYLVNRDRRLITKSRFLGAEAFLKQVVDTEPVRACASQEQSEISGTWDNYAGHRVLGAAMCLPDLGWTLVVETYQEEALRQVNTFTVAVNIIIVLVSVMVIALGSYFGRKIVGPIIDLSDTSKEISKGNLRARARVYSDDETGVLARNFNEMADQLVNVSEDSRRKAEELTARNKELIRISAELEAAKTGLEGKVAERTEELESAKRGLEQQVLERTKELREKIMELEKFNNLAVGRELKMMELKKEIQRLKHDA